MNKAKEAGNEVDKLGNDIANKYAGKVTPINFKSENSITRKVNDELGGDVTQLKDAVRNTVVVPYNKLNDVVSQLRTNPKFVRVKVQEGPEYYGYKGVITNIKTSNGIYGEMQVNSPGMIYAKEPKAIALNYMDEGAYNSIAEKTGLPGGLGHHYYEEIRQINPVTASEIDLTRRLTLIEESKKYYSNFLGL